MNKIRTRFVIVFQLLIVLSVLTSNSYCSIFSGSGLKISNNKENLDITDNSDNNNNNNRLCFAMSSQDSQSKSGLQNFRVGGLERDSKLNELALHAGVDLDNLDATPSETTSSGEKTQEELEREQRQRRFKELIDSGIIDPNRKEAPPGKVYTLPVVKPKLL